MTARRVVRGGAWNDNQTNARAAYRDNNAPDNRNNNIGFRLARASSISGTAVTDRRMNGVPPFAKGGESLLALDPFDHFVKRELRCPAYVRYVDDFALFGDRKRELWNWKQAIVERLARLRLTLHAGAADVRDNGLLAQ